VWRRFGEGTDFLDGADADSVGFAQGAVDRASFGDTHFGTLDNEGHIGGICVTVADEAATSFRLVDRSFERPPLRLWIAKVRNSFTVNTSTTISGRQSY